MSRRNIAIVVFVIGVALVVAGVLQELDERRTNDRLAASGGSPTTTVATVTTVPVAPVPAGPEVTAPLLTTTTAFVPPPVGGSVVIEPTSAPGSWPYPPDPAQPGTSPTIRWNVPLQPGQRFELRGAAPGTPDARLSTATNGQFTLCPGAIKASCESAPGTYRYTATVTDEGGAVVAQTTLTLRVTG